MASALNRTTKEYRQSVHTPDFPVADWVIEPVGADALIAAAVPRKYWIIDPDDSVREMTAAEKDAALLGSEQMGKLLQMKAQVTGYIGNKFDLGQQITMMALWGEGQDKGFANRKSKVQGVVDWVNTVLDYFYTQKNAVLGATTVAAVQAVTLDLAQFDATAPSTTVEEVKNTVS